MAMGSMSSGEPDGEGAYRPMSDINVTPMVDVMLVLLIIFMVAAPLMMVGVPVQLPKTSAAKVSQPRQPIVVSIDREGRAFVGEEPLAAEDITERLAAMAAADKDAVVYVRGDRSIAYGRIMEVMGQVSSAGFAKVSLLAEAPTAPPKGAAPKPVAPVPGAPVPRP